MAKIKILVADNSVLIQEGFRSIINSVKDFKLVGEADKAEVLSEKLLLHQPNVLVIDYASSFFCIDDILVIHQEFPDVNILAITNPQGKSTISKAIENGVVSHLLKDCGKEEIIEALRNTARKQQFFCGKIVDIILSDKTTTSSQAQIKSQDKISCEGIKLSAREIEIIQLVADGLTNKEIADKLFLSTHTITTHRKNIMSKLGVNNTAGLVMYAIRQNLLDQNKFAFTSN